MVRKVGLEPTRPCGHKLLRLTRLPIPPLPHRARPRPEASGSLIIAVPDVAVKAADLTNPRPALIVDLLMIILINPPRTNQAAARIPSKEVP